MNNSILVYFYEADNGKFFGSYNTISMSFVKERYTPYSAVRLNIISETSVPNLCEIRVSIDNKVIHQGVADRMESRKTSDGLYHISLYSRGYTAALGVNQPVPRINSNVNLNDIITANNISLPHISCEQDTKTVNYVYILDKDTLWDAIVAYTLKAYNNYPYIRGSNTVMASPFADPVSFEYSSSVTELISGVNLSNLISQINMKDYDGNYSTYELENAYAIDRNIVRQNKINIDEQWLAEPQTALKKRIFYSNRAARYKAVKVYGYGGEDLFDKMTVTSPDSDDIKARDIHKIEITADKRGVFTKLYTYYDSYSGDIA